MPNLLAKTYKYFLSEPLAKLINSSIQTGKYPTKFKISKICPISNLMIKLTQVTIGQFHYCQSSTEFLKKPFYNRLSNVIEK